MCGSFHDMLIAKVNLCLFKHIRVRCTRCLLRCQVLFVDLDARRLHLGFDDEGQIIPKKIQKALIAALSDDAGPLTFTMPSVNGITLITVSDGMWLATSSVAECVCFWLAKSSIHQTVYTINRSQCTAASNQCTWKACICVIH